MTVGGADALAFAEQLRSAERSGEPLPLASETFPTLDWDDARRIALARDSLRLEDGDVCVGYKLGWTSAAMRAALGIERPNWGTLWRSQRIDGTLDLTNLRHAKVEPEVVYVAGDRLHGDDMSADVVTDHAAGWSVGIEVVHPRWASYDFTWLDNTADNSSAAAIAVGPVHQIDTDVATVEVTFADAHEERSGRGAEAMGSPAEAVAWLVRQLATEGRSIEAGHIVFSGGLTAPFDVTPGDRFIARTSEIGVVDIAADHPRPGEQ